MLRRLPLLAAAPQGVPCLSCGLCCSYVAVDIDGAETLRGATNILWYLFHPGVSVYVEEGDWMVQFETRCQHQRADHSCGNYETRPPICRTYDETNCEINAESVGQSFYSPREFLAHLERHHKRIHTLIRKRYLPQDASLDGGSDRSSQIDSFRLRHEVLRARARRPRGRVRRAS
jgi:Fe-S-cluster containining protein